ncbi:hypothetical protein [Spirosoma foliorum]|uniref:Uncharacterized protein n=1 Tax=Spirosoma foliorum TaxID=2710596 RepID=A0A7G5H0F7_9BACT|nr:hypothetical protein [Spirosoma foliorum]QMW04599.1 hypothetical protein H3H32_06610 [Spirosoma foliorum]
MVTTREIHFAGTCPSITEIVGRVRRQTGIPASYVADKWLLTNPFNQVDLFSLYQEGKHKIVLISDGPTTDLLGATLTTLLAMGGSFADYTD